MATSRAAAPARAGSAPAPGRARGGGGVTPARRCALGLSATDPPLRRGAGGRLVPLPPLRRRARTMMTRRGSVADAATLKHLVGADGLDDDGDDEEGQGGVARSQRRRGSVGGVADFSGGGGPSSWRRRRDFQYDVIASLGCANARLIPLKKEVLVMHTTHENHRLAEAADSLRRVVAGLRAQGYSRRDVTIQEWRRRRDQHTRALRAAPCVVLNAIDKAPADYYMWLRELRGFGCLLIQVPGNAVRTKRDEADEIRDEALALRELGFEVAGPAMAAPGTRASSGGRARSLSLSRSASALLSSPSARTRDDVNQAAGCADYHVSSADALPEPESLPDKLVAPYSTNLAECAPVREDGVVEVYIYVSATGAHVAERAVLHSKVLPRLAERFMERHVRLVIVDPVETHKGATDATILQAASDCSASIMLTLLDTASAPEDSGLKALKADAFEPVLGATQASPDLEWIDALSEGLSRQEYELMQATGVHSEKPQTRFLDGYHLGGTHVLAYRRDPESIAGVPMEHRAHFVGGDEARSRQRAASLLSTLYACPFVQIRTYKCVFGGVRARGRGAPVPYMSGLEDFERMVEHDLYVRIKHELFSNNQIDARVHWHRPEEIIQVRRCELTRTTPVASVWLAR